VWWSGQGCFSAKTGPRASRRCVRCLRGPSGETWILRDRLPLPEAGLGRGEIVSLEWTEPWLNRTHQAFAALCWWGLPAEIRSFGGTPNYGPRQYHSLNKNRVKPQYSSIHSCWGLALKCYESRTRQHKMLNIKALRPSNHYLPLDITNLGRRSWRTYPLDYDKIWRTFK
jgi:hypothetical protein